jgi:hypothetical protein
LQAALAAFEHACCLYGQRVPDGAAILSIDAALQQVRFKPYLRPACRVCATAPHQ